MTAWTILQQHNILGSFFLWGLDWWIPLPPSTDCHIRLTITSTSATGWLRLLPWKPLLTGEPLHLPLHPSHSSTTSITSMLACSQAAVRCNEKMRERETAEQLSQSDKQRVQRGKSQKLEIEKHVLCGDVLRDWLKVWNRSKKLKLKKGIPQLLREMIVKEVASYT